MKPIFILALIYSISSSAQSVVSNTASVFATTYDVELFKMMYGLMDSPAIYKYKNKKDEIPWYIINDDSHKNADYDITNVLLYINKNLFYSIAIAPCRLKDNCLTTEISVYERESGQEKETLHGLYEKQIRDSKNNENLKEVITEEGYKFLFKNDLFISAIQIPGFKGIFLIPP